MADVFKREDAIVLLKQKRILLIGDSNIRALYKDIIWLLKINSLIGLSFLKRRLEESFLGDKLLSRSELTRGRDFSEHRIFESNKTIVEFLFVTRCYCNNLVKVIKDIENGTKQCPDVILMNSCLWDVSRWGPNGVNEYKTNMEKLMKLFSTSLPKHVLFIWATALPIAALTSGGLIIKQIAFLQAVLRIHVIEANGFAAALVSSYGFDVLDFHHYMRYQIIRRSADGIHFLPTAMRFLTNLLLTHIAISWDVKLPGNLKVFSSCLAEKIKKAVEASSAIEVKNIFKNIERLANTLNKVNTDTPKRRKKKKQVKKILNEEETCEKVQIKSTVRRILVRTPPNYHKNTLVSNRRDSNNFQTNRLQNANDFRMKNFRLLGFDDFNQSSSSYNSSDVYNVPPTYWHPDDVSSHDYGRYDSSYGHTDNAAQNHIYNIYRTVINDHLHNHPYKSSQGRWQAWEEGEAYPCDLGPMRQRRTKYNWRTRYNHGRQWY